MNTTLRVGRRSRRPVSVLAGAALVAGVGLGVVAPGASASPAVDSTDGGSVAPSVEPSQTASSTGSAVEPTASVEPEETVLPGATEPATGPGTATATTSATVTPSGAATTDEPATEDPVSEPAATASAPEVACPGVGDGTDVRTLFSYEYFADDADGWRSLGSTPSWTRPLAVQWFSRPVPAGISSMMVRAEVTLKEGVTLPAGCEYDFSLASYEAEGSSFPTSGQQVFVDHDTDTITADQTSVVLVVAPAECYGQSDLYTSGDVYDGARTPRGPSYSPITADRRMVANWGGGIGCVVPPGEPSGPGTVTPPPSGEPSGPGTVTPPPSEEPSGPGTVTPPPSGEPSAPGGLPTGPAAGSGESVAAGGTGPTTRPGPVRTLDSRSTQRPRESDRVLARTGAEAWTIAALAGVLVVAGGAMTALAGTSGRTRRH